MIESFGWMSSKAIWEESLVLPDQFGYVKQILTCTFFIDYEISLVFNLYSIRNYCWATSKFNESCTHAFNSHLHKFRGTTIQRCYSLSGLILRANYRLYCMEDMLTRDYFQMNFKVCHRTSIITGKRIAINSY